MKGPIVPSCGHIRHHIIVLRLFIGPLGNVRGRKIGIGSSGTFGKGWGYPMAGVPTNRVETAGRCGRHIASCRLHIHDIGIGRPCCCGRIANCGYLGEGRRY